MWGWEGGWSQLSFGCDLLFYTFFNVYLTLFNFIDSLTTQNLLHSVRTNVKQYKKPGHYRVSHLVPLQIFLFAAYFVCCQSFQLIILFEIGTLAPSSDSRSDMIDDLVQNIRFIFLHYFFTL